MDLVLAKERILVMNSKLDKLIGSGAGMTRYGNQYVVSGDLDLLKAHIKKAAAEDMLELIEDEPTCWVHNEDYKGADGIEVGGRKLYPCYTNESAQEINFKLDELRQKIKEYGGLR